MCQHVTVSILFHLYSHYYVTMNIGNPAKPYFLDVDTGSDLTWLQCDAPCQSCNKVQLMIVQNCIITLVRSTVFACLIMAFVSE